MPEQKVNHFKPLIASPFYCDPRDPQDAVPEDPEIFPEIVGGHLAAKALTRV